MRSCSAAEGGGDGLGPSLVRPHLAIAVGRRPLHRREARRRELHGHEAAAPVGARPRTRTTPARPPVAVELGGVPAPDSPASSDASVEVPGGLGTSVPAGTTAMA